MPKPRIIHSEPGVRVVMGWHQWDDPHPWFVVERADHDALGHETWHRSGIDDSKNMIERALVKTRLECDRLDSYVVAAEATFREIIEDASCGASPEKLAQLARRLVDPDLAAEIDEDEKDAEDEPGDAPKMDCGCPAPLPEKE